MYTWDYNLFIGDDTVNVHVGFAIGDTFYSIAELTASDEEDLLKDSLDRLKTQIERVNPESLVQLVELVDASLAPIKSDLVSFACAYTVADVMYVVTRGSGEIYIARDGAMQKLVEGDSTASGPILVEDYFLLANKTFSSGLELSFLQNLLSTTKPQKVIETITPELKGTNNVGMIALFMQAHKRRMDETADTEVVVEDEDINEYVGGGVDNRDVMYEGSSPDPVYMPSSTTSSAPAPDTSARKDSSGMRLASVKELFVKLQSGSSRSRKITLGVVIVLLIVLSWSIISGNARRQKALFVERVASQQKIIEGKLSEAENLAGLNTQKSLQLIDESRQTLTDLQQEAKAKKLESLPELQTLATTISAAEQGIKKVEKGTYEEFYDLDLIEKGAHASAMYVDGESLALLDSENGKLYILNISEKSVDTYSASQLKKASYVSIHQREPYFFGSSIGVYKFTDSKKAENVIPVDNEWGDIQDFQMYSGNIYLLDKGKSDIHKYLVAEEGYSLKKSYFGTGEATGLGGADAMSIDSAVYVANGAKMQKFASGVRSSFPLSLPDESAVTFEDVFASADTSSVYVMDKDSQRIFIASKDGVFEKQLSADIIKGADDFVVDPTEGILILSRDRLYKIKE